ncbi:TPA: hypothetical protein N0F65_009050 [Lagenidium giganteum]|uniref:EF-hand domain-containing protein n=1 Tax=Lagenidium giganteum TaxID=4803 RepID=A0AAV2YHW1_9STRA|nr:TPA: hypothetical protein N0F65_009050 [Lagenidium giganteum]
MILCSIIEFVEVESFKDVFKRFDAHGKMCFLHHLSVLESTDHLQMIVEQLPNAGETVFRFYLVSCGSNSEECQRAKNVFFHKILGPEMEHYFLTDLAAYLNEDHWLFLGKEYDKHLQDRLNRKHLRLQMMADGDESNEETNDQESNEQKDVSASSMEQFQLMMWNFLHQNRLDSAQVLSLIQTTMLPSLEEKEQSALMDTCLDHFQTLEAKWRRLLLFVEEIEADSGTTGIDNVRMIRIKMLKRLFSMLSRDERVTWLEKINKKYGFQTAAPRKLEHQQSSVIMVPVNLDDPKPHVLLMKMDIKMAWMECLLDAIANDKEYSARMTMLKQVLRPFLNGETLPAAGSGAVAVVQQKMTLAAGEKAINNILNNFNIPDKLKLMQKFATDDTRTARKMDRASSPVKELEEQPQIISVPDPTLLPTNNEDILTALRELLLRKSEQDVLKILTDAMITKPGTPSELVAVPEVDAMEEEAPITKPLQRSPSKSNSVRGSFKRKVTAVVAMSEPMEWQRFVKIGMVDVGCQTTFEDRSPSPQDDGYEAQSFSSSQVPVFTRNRPQLTLNALLPKQPIGPGRKTKESKYQKINSGAVPRPIASLITSWRMNTDQLVQFAKKSLPTVLRIVADALGESLTAGRRKSNQPSLINRGRDLTLAQIVYQSFLHSYGLPGIADMHLLAFSCAIETYRTQHLRVEHFARYCFEEVTRFELQYYLEFLECIVCDDANLIGSTLAATNRAGGPQQAQPVGAAAAPRRMRYVPRVVVPDKENWTIPVEKAQEAAQLCFRAMRKPSVTAFCDRLVALAMQGTSAVLDSATGAMLASTTVHTATAAAVAAAATAAASSPNQAVPSDLFINVDFLLQLVVLEWRDEQLRRENHLLDAFRAGDVNGDGQLTSAEFTQIVLSIDRNRDLGEILLMYSDTVRRTQCEAINTEVFLQVARKHELDKMAWSEDGDLHNITNTVSDLESTWAQVRSFFLGTLEALVRDLTTQHFLRNCEGAGCGCLKCILDSYIGFQRMRRDFDLAQRGKSTRAYPISESLVWGRFWHLMRQLYEASSASDGILTPWEGSEYMRTEPAPPMASRLITLRRDALPNFLFPDTNRISAVVSSVNEQESYDADEINRRFVNLHGLMTYREAEATSNNTPS